MSTVEKERDNCMFFALLLAQKGAVAEVVEKEMNKSLDSLISAVDSDAFARGKAEGEERLQKYTAEYLKEGIKRCSAALAQGKAEGAVVGVSAARRQLMAASASVTKQEGTHSINGVRHYLIPVRAFSVPIAFVLAPTKEGP